MSHTNVAHRRTHNLLLISKLLSQQSQASPFTLVIDSLELPAKPLLREYLRRAKLSKGTITVFLAFETVAKLKGVDYFVPCQDTVEGVGWKRIVKDVTDVISRASGKSKKSHTECARDSMYLLIPRGFRVSNHDRFSDDLGFAIARDDLEYEFHSVLFISASAITWFRPGAATSNLCGGSISY